MVILVLLSEGIYMRKRKLFYFSLCATLLFWCYIIFKIAAVYNALQPIDGTITQVENSRSRIPVYTFHLQPYKSRFKSAGNGTLSLLKPVPDVHAEVRFYIREQDKAKTWHNDIVPAFGLHHYTLVDCYYFTVRPSLGQHLLIMIIGFMTCCFNAIAYAAFKTRLTWRIFGASLIIFFLLMLL